MACRFKTREDWKRSESLVEAAGLSADNFPEIAGPFQSAGHPPTKRVGETFVLLLQTPLGKHPPFWAAESCLVAIDGGKK